MQYRPISQRLKTQLKNRGHGLLLLFVITNWAQKQLENFDTSGTGAQNKENPANFFFFNYWREIKIVARVNWDLNLH